MNGPGLAAWLASERSFMFHFHLSLVVWSVQSEALHSRRHSDGLSEPAAFYLSQWQMTNCKMENGKCLRLRYNARGVSASGSEALPAFIFCGELMFERYTEKARRVIFFARYEASQFGAPAI